MRGMFVILTIFVR